MVMMMGTKEEDVVKEPQVKPVFVEDMNDAELALSVSIKANHCLIFSFENFHQFAIIYFSWICQQDCIISVIPAI